ncbi:unnamed protein product [Adineta ricciae]|uniref:Adenylate cyclase n=1 Tax=Adineta ricciae TaxID=249248 RepID=A0A814NF30_ADIRI|nr:unnamed protein product [Adineta ricciae]
MSVSVSAFRWLDILEKEFDKTFVDLDLSFNEIDEEQPEIIAESRAKMATLSSCFAQLVHKVQTIAQANAKLEAQLVDVRAEMIDIKTDRQALEQQMKDTLAQLHASQLECQILKNQSEIEGADMIRRRLEEQVTKQRNELKESLVSDVKAHELEKENEKLKKEIINLESEIYGSRLAAKYLDKELAGRIQQIQLLGRDLRGPNHEKLWNQLEAEIHLHRHKTVIRACRGPEKVNKILTSPPGHDVNVLKKRQGVGELRTVKFYKDANQALGISITGGKEHGLPILISEIHERGLAWTCGQLYVGDSILSVNKYDLRDKKHAEAVQILSSLKGDITMTVIFVAPDESDGDETSSCDGNTHLQYKFLNDEEGCPSKAKDIESMKNLTISNGSHDKNLLQQINTTNVDNGSQKTPSVIDRPTNLTVMIIAMRLAQNIVEKIRYAYTCAHICSREAVSNQPTESIEAKTKTSSSSIRRRKPLRRIWSRGLPSLATNTVKMVVATLQIGSTANGQATREEEESDDNDDENSIDEEYHIGQQVQAHIPDIVSNNLNDLIDQQGRILIPNEHMYNRVTLLFLDVSGFTSLTEQYSNDAHLGIDQLTHTLNSYFDKLVSEILSHNGDIYKFAGDAILALWTDESNGAEQALKCALSLQEKYGAYETNVDVVLRMKVALAYGSVRILFIGTDEFKHYILTGDCVKDVNICEQLCEPGDVIITGAVYEQVQSIALNCEYAPIRDELEGDNQYFAVKYCDLEEDNFDATTVSDRLTPSSYDISNGNHFFDYESSNISPHTQALYDKIDNLMKTFLLGCVYQRLDRKQSLDYLSELRRVTITFINLDISDEQYEDKNLCQHVQKVFIQIYELTKMMGGVLTKALLFDKGWSFLCVFGLPGYKQGDDTANALKCAHMIHSTINKQCEFINKCSIGVATGLTYCGVVGHAARCEYTVIGRKVNLAARLMCNYPNTISCDQETYYNSRLNSRFFQILPDKILKGMHNVGIIWQYSEYQENVQMQNNSNQGEMMIVSDGTYPLLGRKLELMIIAVQIMLMDEPINKRRDLAAIIFEG